MSEFTIKPATRQGIRPLVGLYSESGCGKTMSGLLLARGFVGPQGKIGMIDTESGRGSLYADVIAGGYDVLEMREPFSPARHVQAIQAIEQSGAQIGILDSGSHEWEGLGSVNDMAAENEKKSGKGLHVWREPKMEHAKFMLRLLQSNIPWIICLRAKYKTRMVKGQNNRNEVAKDDMVSPIQSEDFIFEMTCHGYIDQEHKFHLTKCSHPDLRKCMPNNEPVVMEHGKALAAWCAAPGGPGATNGQQDRKSMLTELRTLTTEIHGWVPELGATGWTIGKPKLQKWLTEELGQTVALDQQTDEQIRETLKLAHEKIEQAVMV